MDGLQECIDYFKFKLKMGLSRSRRKYYEDAVSAMEELQGYREVGTFNECRGYKIHSQAVSSLNDCNSCDGEGDVK